MFTLISLHSGRPLSDVVEWKRSLRWKIGGTEQTIEAFILLYNSKKFVLIDTEVFI